VKFCPTEASLRRDRSPRRRAAHLPARDPLDDEVLPRHLVAVRHVLKEYDVGEFDGVQNSQR